MKCDWCGLTIPEMPEDATQEELLCNECAKCYDHSAKFKELLGTDRRAACEKLAAAKIRMWLENDGEEEAVRVLANWLEDGLNLGNDEVLLSLVEGMTNIKL